jgi:hypothetical protein
MYSYAYEREIYYESLAHIYYNDEWIVEEKFLEIKMRMQMISYLDLVMME